MPNYYYTDETGQKRGLITEQQLATLAGAGIITPKTPIETQQGHKSLAGHIPGLFDTTSSPPVQATKPVSPKPLQTTVASGQYEYKCVAAPMIMEVISTNAKEKALDEARCVSSYGELINKECHSLWEFYSMEQITVRNNPGCLGVLFGVRAESTIYNMLVFARLK